MKAEIVGEDRVGFTAARLGSIEAHVNSSGAWTSSAIESAARRSGSAEPAPTTFCQVILGASNNCGIALIS
jgi:hypothetical protein